MAQCLTPLVLSDKKTYMNQGKTITVACGKCPTCLKRRVSNWSFRLMQQQKVCHNSYFITLTYDTAHAPITQKRFMSLSKSDLQKFFKRLRRAHDGKQRRPPFKLRSGFRKGSKYYWPKPIKYFAVGEYGSRYMRPHYHVILFNVSVELVQACWTAGLVHVGEVNQKSIGYTLKYMMKNGKIPIHSNDDRLPEFQLMSKGLGANYVTEKMAAWHKADLLNRIYCNVEEGKKISMPRYYKDRIYTLEERSQVSGFYKGQFEQDSDGYELTVTPKARHERVESVKAQFGRMFRDAQKGRKIE